MAARSRVVFSEQNFTNLRNVLMQRKSRIGNLDKFREAAVLVPLCVQQNDPHILFTKRSFKMRNHKGQISFPGGVCDEGESPVDTALRETWEELGINRDQVDVLGMLTPLPDRVGTTLITPVVGRLTLHNILDHITTNPDEVSYAFTVPLSELMNKNNQRFTRFKRVPLKFPVFLCGNEPIWGLTGFILDVVINVLEQTMAYIRFSKCDVFHVPTCYPWKSPTRKFPTLTDGQRTISDTEQIVQYLMAKGYDLDQTLNPEEKAISLAFKALINEKLQPALLYLQWMDGTSYVDFTRHWYATQLPFPLTLILPNMIYNSVKRKLSTTVSKVSATEMNSNVFVADGVNCLDVIAHQLGSKPFMCGSSPTSLDASVFAHLCLIIQQPLPGNNALWKHLYSHSNLVDYCSKIRQTFFPELTEAPYPNESAIDNRLLPSLKDPGMWAILGLGAVFLALQYWRYRVPETATESLPSDVSIDDVDIS